MKKKIFLFVLLFTVFMSFLSAQNREIFSEPITFEGMQLYPLGWSPDGNFAYIQPYDIGGLCGYCPRYKYTVLSTVTDETITQQEFNALDSSGMDVIKIATFWEQNYSEYFEADMAVFGIDTSAPGEYGELPLQFRGSTYDVEYDSVSETVEWSPWEAPVIMEIDVIKSFQMTVSASGRGKKRVFSYTAEKYDDIISFSADAYIMSPFEPRMVLLVVERYMGAEEERTRLSFVGAHLTAGYK